MHRIATRRAVLVMAACLVPGLAAAQSASAARPSGRTVTTQLGASIRNAGLQQRLDVTWRRPFGPGGHPLTDDAHVAGGGGLAVTPAGARVSMWAEVAPLSVFTLRAGVEPAQYFGTSNALWSAADRDQTFDTSARKILGGVAGRTTRWFVTPSVQVRAGHLVAQGSADLERFSSTAAGPFYYETTRDTLLAVGGDEVVNANGFVAWERRTAAGGVLRVGGLVGVMRPEGRPDHRITKAGLLVSRQLVRGQWGAPAPTLTASVYRYLDHPYRRGQLGAAVSIATGWPARR